MIPKSLKNIGDSTVPIADFIDFVDTQGWLMVNLKSASGAGWSFDTNPNNDDTNYLEVEYDMITVGRNSSSCVGVQC